MRLIFLLVASVLLSLNSFAQHDFQSSFYQANKFLINPANTGGEDFAPQFILGYRYDFAGIAGSLRRPMFGFHSPVSNDMGLGGLLTVEQEGVFQYYSFAGSYSYRIVLSRNNYIRFGFSSGLFSREVNMGKVKVDDVNDNVLQGDYFSNVYYFAGTGFELGLGGFSLNVSLPKLYSGEDNSFVAASVSGMEYAFPAGDAVFTPSVYVHYWKDNPTRFDLNLLYKLPDKYFLLLSARSDKSAAVGGGISISDINISYAYEMNAQLIPSSKGTHEVLLSYNLSSLKFRKKIR